MTTRQTITVQRTLVGIPIPGGQKYFTAKPSSLSRGDGFDRLAVRILNSVKCDAMIALQQTVEMSDIKQGKYSLGDIKQ